MKRNQLSFPSFSEKQLLQWAASYEQLLFLNPNHYGQQEKFSHFPKMLAVGAKATLHIPEGGKAKAFEQLKAFHQKHGDWLFGHLNYDLKNEVEDMKSRHKAKTEFPDLHFFVPEHLCFFEKDGVRIETYSSPSKLKEEILATKIADNPQLTKLHFHPQISQEAYLNMIDRLKEHIRQGDFYEINFCQEFIAEQAEIQPVPAYWALNEMSPMPFSAFYKLKDQYAMVASPERYVKKVGHQIYSEPIKGTSRRRTDPLKDQEQINYLKTSEKEMAENMMIVDLVRNDLARTAIPGTVRVPELFEVYSFPQVHQLISTISATMAPEYHWTDVLENSFPMGSMTGAPKISVMQHADQYESGRRELYAGTLGYVSPEGDFDFNVVIRSLFYNDQKKFAHYWVGGAITIDSEAEDEYRECLLKAKAIQSIFSKN
ncbi:anthranilate synthase component I family protein [Persicobacter diffluens]|uniref:Para-aminobenzoate synthase n=1 Tax=Persicobacter diffluens TaxID=981 RepID=A0AAN5AJH8_9BACT|nr:para-aminobenzoate synthase [Persicobacter diffluens]